MASIGTLIYINSGSEMGVLNTWWAGGFSASENTLRSYQAQLGHGKYTLGNAPNRRSAANAPDRMFSGRAALAPGSEVQIDSSPFDFYVKGPTGKRERAALTIMIDKATRSIIAKSVMPGHPKGADHTLLLARCLAPRPLRQQPIDPFSVASLPWSEVLTSEEVDRTDATLPFIFPQVIITDNGADFLSATFRSACEYCEVSLVQASIHTPTDKPLVERAFHTIKTGFAEHLPGFTGGSVDKRGTSPDSGDGLLDIFTLQTLFDRWITVVYQNTTNEGLHDPYDPSVELSPNAAYLAMFDVTGPIPIPFTADDYISLLPIKETCVLRDGITINYRRYDSPKLEQYRERHDAGRHKSKRTLSLAFISMTIIEDARRQVKASALHRFNGGREPIDLPVVEPIVVVFTADVAWSGRAFRHSVRFVRTQPNLASGHSAAA